MHNRLEGKAGSKIFLAVISVMLLISIVENVPTVKSQVGELTFYADTIKFPTPGVPEPVLDGGIFNVTVKMDSNVQWLNATIYNDFEEATANLVEEHFSPERNLWTLSFKLPSGLGEGAYSLNLTYMDEGLEHILTQPRSLWVLPKDPVELTILACGDVKPEGLPYWREMVKEANLIDPDLIVFLGDLVNVPNIRSEWLGFLEPFLLIKDPIFVIPGNHEYSDVGEAEFYERIIGPVNYTVTFGNFLLVGLDTDLHGWIRLDRLHWLESVLKKNMNKTKIIFFHHPLFDPKIKGKVNSIINIDSWEDFDKLLQQGYIYSEAGSWIDHPEETKELFRLIIQYDVRLIMSEHIHTDLNVIVRDQSTGKKHYFISPAALAYDIPDYDLRGFKLIEIYANGTLNENTLYYPGTGIFKYPNSIPIDSGCTVNYRPKKPYKIGFIEYYYNGKNHVKSFHLKNQLNITVKNPRVIFNLPSDISIEDYNWHPFKPAYTYIQKNGKYYIKLENLTLNPNDNIWFTVESIQDTDKPSIKFTDLPGKINPGEWLKFKVVARDGGWGVKDVKVEYSVDGEWIKPQLMDLSSFDDKTVTYTVWIKAPNENATMKIRAIVEDFSNKTSNYIYGEVAVGVPPPPQHKLTITSQPIEGVSFNLNGKTYTTPYTGKLVEGKYTVKVFQEVEVDKVKYRFKEWSDGSKDLTRTIDLNSDLTLTITYEKVEAPQPSTQSVIYIAVAATLALIVVAYYFIKVKRK